MGQKSSRRPGRPRIYDRDDVVAKAQGLFWREGAEAVSLDELGKATGLHKPSLYAAFGGKRGLYVAALKAYLADGAEKVGDALARAGLRETLVTFFESDLDVFCGEEGLRGCFLIATAVQAGVGDAEIRTSVRGALDRLRGGFRARFARAVEDGELPADAGIDVMADLVVDAHVALAVDARAGVERAMLAERTHRLIDFLCPADRSATCS